MRPEDCIVGTRVRCVSQFAWCDECVGLTGTIIQVRSYSHNDVLVEFDTEFPSGHDGEGLGAPGRCRYGSYVDLELEAEAQVPTDIIFSFEETMCF